MSLSFHLKPNLLAATALSMAFAAPAFAQDAGGTSGNDIVVTAQRVEQRLQDVPISVTVLDQNKLANNNITNIKDIAAFTPSLAVNSRYGSDNSTFSIRGFTQDQRTFATVGVFFADVVALRGSGATLGGDGAGPGAMFDLQNVQVLKGPQGTLFGRNVTGGAVLLVPRKPTDKLEGYIEGGAGNYNMWRLQGVVNLPISDSFRVRVGADHMDRHGYLKNIGNLGDGKYGDRDLGDVNYTAVRASAVLDITPDIENYTVGTWSHSQSNGTIPHLEKCRSTVMAAISRNPAESIPMGQMACDLLAREAGSFWNVANRLPDNQSTVDQWQVSNTLTWKATDNLTVKYIAAYGELRGDTNLAFYGDYFVKPGITFGTEVPGQVTGFAFTHIDPTQHANAQSSLVQELQFQGHSTDNRFTWQAGAYFEKNKPLGYSSSQTATYGACVDINTFNCLPLTPGFTAGSGTFQLAKSTFTDYAFYGQASYEITDKLKFTAGIRHTWDKVESLLRIENVNFGTQTVTCANTVADSAQGARPIAQRYDICREDLSKSTKAPTWTLNLDYKPIDNVMVYAKWSRGYRQGGVAMFSPDQLQKFDAEKVDTYEIGAKTNWRGSLPGFFNISGFYNDFRNQQLLLGVSCVSNEPGFKGPCNPNAAIVNAAKSRLTGVEIEAGVTAFDVLRLGVGYSYIHSKIAEFTKPTLPTSAIYNSVASPLPAPTALDGTRIEFYNWVAGTVPHKLNLSAELQLPVPETMGKLSVGGSFIYTGRYRVQTDAAPSVAPNVGVLPSSSVVNLNVNWENVGGAPVDAAFFVTNVTNEHVYLQSVDGLGGRGFAAYLPGEPRMWGFRLKYRFGQ